MNGQMLSKRQLTVEASSAKGMPTCFLLIVRFLPYQGSALGLTIKTCLAVLPVSGSKPQHSWH